MILKLQRRSKNQKCLLIIQIDHPLMITYIRESKLLYGEQTEQSIKNTELLHKFFKYSVENTGELHEVLKK
jgi:hypothetical protein